MIQNKSFYIILAFLFLISNQSFANITYPETNFKKPLLAIDPPVITATGNQIYCPGSPLKIVETISITNDPAEPETDAMYIQVSSGYVNGQDFLELTNLASHPTIIRSWDAAAGKLKLFSPSGIKIPYTDFVSAIKDVVYTNSSANPSGIRTFSITIGQANYLPSTAHYYQYVSSLGITWTNARIAAESLDYYGLEGYLATILSLDEAKLSGEQAAGAGWIGGSDAETEGVWKWVTGPDIGTVFWNGAVNGSSPNFSLWNTNEPNQLGNEDYAHITAPGVGNAGSWNDMSNTGEPSGNYQPKGYIVEYGGMPGDPVLQISASTIIVIPRIESTASGSICGSGNVTLQATASNGTAYWYTTKTGGSAIASGNSYTTPIINTTTSYYVDGTNGNCQDVPRTEVIATVKTLPTITSTSATPVCDSGTATLVATASAGTINWYSASTGGSPLGSGTTFTTTSINTTTTYYVDAFASGCTSQTRTAVIATVNESPTVSSTSPSSVCGSGTVTLEAESSDGNINWYTAPAGGSSLSSGNSFTTPTIDITTTYYAEPILNGCRGPRIGVTATVYPIATTMEEVILCQGESITLDASISGMKYLWSPGGETTQRIVALTIGEYSVTISSPTAVSCDSKKDISVTERPKPIISSVLVNENSITIELINYESYYEYSINGLDFQVSNQFSYISSGQHTAFVRDNNDCNLVAQDFTIFTVPKYFTPNNDGFNDEWKINEMGDYPNSTAQIFDRYGKLIINLNSSNYIWDGKYENKILPADDYWYRLKLDNSTPEITGHFTLKR
jgi:gliding motility-associated-like protein